LKIPKWVERYVKIMTLQKSDPVDGNSLGWVLTAVLGFVMYIVMAATTYFCGKLWEDIFGPPQNLWGFSRIWLDTIFLPFYVLTVMMYLAIAVEKRDKLLEPGCIAAELKVPFRVFVAEYPWFSTFGLFLIIAGLASIPFSLATGVAVIIILAVLIGIFYALPKKLASVFLKLAHRRFLDKDI